MQRSPPFGPPTQMVAVQMPFGTPAGLSQSRSDAHATPAFGPPMQTAWTPPPGSWQSAASISIPPGFGPAFAWGVVASAVSGFLVIWGLLAYLRRRSFAPFVLYRVAAALFVLGIIAAGVRSATI